MPFLKKSFKILINQTHNEMLNESDEEFADFFKFLKQQSIKVDFNRNRDITKSLFSSIDIFVIGNPIGELFSSSEIDAIIDYVREGGALLLMSEYGSDFLQKTNLNDISNKHFGIYFEKNIVKEHNKINQNCPSILNIRKINKSYKFSNQIRELVIGGTCSLFLNQKAKLLLKTDQKEVWSEIYDDTNEKWIKNNENQQVIAAYTVFGQGKVVAMGDIDILTNDPNIGLNQFDNKKFILNILNWFSEPVKKDNVMHFILTQLGEIQNSIIEVNKKIINLIETSSVLEERISMIEKHQKIHLGKKFVLINEDEESKYQE